VTTSGGLWQISVTTSPEAEEAVAALLENLFRLPATVFAAAGSRPPVVAVYCPDRRPWSGDRRATLEAGLRRIQSCGLSIRPAKISARRLARKDWADAWHRHCQPLAVGRSLLIKPSWSRRRPRPGQAMVVLDPGLSFGTGHHPTTAFCLRQVVAGRNAARALAFLDLGTGSGILAIAAAKLGYTPVHAWDNDPQAVRAARRNARKNRVTDRVAIRLQDVRHARGSPRRRYDLLCANLTDDLLLSAVDAITGLLRPGGILILAGVRTTEFPRVRRAYEAAGVRLRRAQTQNGWRSALFEM
jgi:ribosomal protein L11 methyltransferase